MIVRSARRGQRGGAYTPGISGGEEDEAEHGRLGDHDPQVSMVEAWGQLMWVLLNRDMSQETRMRC